MTWILGTQFDLSDVNRFLDELINLTCDENGENDYKKYGFHKTVVRWDQDLQIALPSSMKWNTFISEFSMENNPTAMINKINSQKQNRSIVQMKKILFSMNFYMSLQ